MRANSIAVTDDDPFRTMQEILSEPSTSTHTSRSIMNTNHTNSNNNRSNNSLDEIDILADGTNSMAGCSNHTSTTNNTNNQGQVGVDINLGCSISTFDAKVSQLPDVEVYKAANGKNIVSESASRKKKFFIKLIGIFMIIGLVFISIGVIVSMMSKSKGSTGTNELNSGASNVKESGIDSDGNPTSENIYNPNGSSYPNGGLPVSGSNAGINIDYAARLDEVLELCMAENWSDPEKFALETSPQYLAMKWIAMDDQFNTEIDDSITFIQRYVLATLYFSLDGPNWKHPLNFLNDESVCSWNTFWQGKQDENESEMFQVGIICDENDIIKRIFIPNNNLKGQLPKELRLLTSLKEINFNTNEIIGTIPREYSELVNMEAIVLDHNQINDSYPQFFHELTQLQVINLGHNDISGEIPYTLNAISTTLKTFNCENCKLTGNLTPLFGMNYIESIHLGSNSLSGELTSDLYNSWRALKELDVSSNQLQGYLPENMFMNEQLLVLDLSNNQFTGPIVNVYKNTIPSNTNLKLLALNGNRLSGSIEWVIQLKQLLHLDLSTNSLTGSIPTDLSELVQLKYLYLAMNPFTIGPIPTELTMLTNLVDLSLQKTNRNGIIPYQMDALKKLTLLDLSDNQITGIIPMEIGTLTQLKYVLLRRNLLQGAIPDSFISLQNLDTLAIDGNANINSGVENVCNTNEIKYLHTFLASCTQFESACPCCTLCCDEVQDDRCTNPTFFASIDPSSDYNYVRQSYILGEGGVNQP